MFNKLFGGSAKNKTIEVISPVTGKLVPLSEVSDEAFAQGYMGPGAAIEPTEGRVVAPFDGKVAHLIDTHHALVVEHASGIQLLIHVGINTVELKGEGYRALVATGDAIKAGQPLLEFDLEQIKSKGYAVTTPVTVASEDFAGKFDCEYKDVQAGKSGAIHIDMS